jgi:hypothetical protein
MQPGYKLTLFSASDPIPDGLTVTEIRTAGTHRLTTERFRREHIVQKTAYNRYRLRLFAQPSDNISLISSASTLRITLKSEVVHIAQVIEWNQANPAGMSLRQIDIIYIDTNEANYGNMEPVNNWLTSEAIATKITAGSIAQATTCRYRVEYLLGAVPIDASYYTLLAPVADLSEPNYPEEDNVNGIRRPNVTQAQGVYRVTMYVNEATRRTLHNHSVIFGSRSSTSHKLITGGYIYPAVQPPSFEIEAIQEASDLFRVMMTFPYSNSYVHNY